MPWSAFGQCYFVTYFSGKAVLLRYCYIDSMSTKKGCMEKTVIKPYYLNWKTFTNKLFCEQYSCM
jgi:hypothetical protein